MNYDWLAVRQGLKILVQHACWALNRHRPSGKPDIWVYGCRRSGTTLLMQMIARNPGVKFCFEPTKALADANHEVVLRSFTDCLALVYPQTEQRIRDRLEAIISGRSHMSEQWKFWAPDFHFRSDRIVFKIINSMELIGWLEATFNVQTLYIIRHPLSQAVSLMYLGWGERYSPYLASDAYIGEFLSPSGRMACQKVHESGSELEKQVLTWCCENAPLLRDLQRHPSRGFLSYESLVMDREGVVGAMSHAYDLPNVDGMLAAAGRVSRSSDWRSAEDTKAAIIKGERQRLISAWRSHVSAEDEARAMSLLEHFGIDLYEVGNNLATRPPRWPEGPGTSAKASATSP